jgi:hypothetical protein
VEKDRRRLESSTIGKSSIGKRAAGTVNRNSNKAKKPK